MRANEDPTNSPPDKDNTDSLLARLTAFVASVYHAKLTSVDLYVHGHERPLHWLTPPVEIEKPEPARGINDTEVPGSPLCPSERAILELLESTGHRLLGEDIRAELCHPKGPYGERTINRDLSALVKRGKIDNPRRGSGYGLLGWE